MLDHSPITKTQIGGLSALDHSPLQNELNNYLLACRVEGKSLGTLDAYHRRVGAFIQFVKRGFAPLLANQLTSQHIRLFLLSLQERQLNSSTINASYRSLNTFFHWLVAEGFIEKSPMQNIKPPTIPKTKPKPFSSQDIDNLLLLCSGNRFVNVRNQAIILLFLDTGLRLAELARIELSHINFDRETIKVMGKGAKERVVRMGKRTQKALLKYLLMRRDDYSCLWITEERKPLTRAGVQLAIKKLCHRAEVTDAKPGPHTFRHTFATMAIRNGANIFYVQSLLGHSTLAMTRRYAATINSEDAVISHRYFGPVDKMNLK